MALLAEPYLSYNAFKSGSIFNPFRLRHITESDTKVLEVSSLPGESGTLAPDYQHCSRFDIYRRQERFLAQGAKTI